MTGLGRLPPTGAQDHLFHSDSGLKALWRILHNFFQLAPSRFEQARARFSELRTAETRRLLGRLTARAACGPKVRISRHYSRQAASSPGQEYGRSKDNPGRNTRFLTPPATEGGGGDLPRPQDLPNCTFALLTHASLAAPASASHFSIATL